MSLRSGASLTPGPGLRKPHHQLGERVNQSAQPYQGIARVGGTAPQSDRRALTRPLFEGGAESAE